MRALPGMDWVCYPHASTLYRNGGKQWVNVVQAADFFIFSFFCSTLELGHSLRIRNLPHKCIALVLEHAYLLYCAVGREGLLQDVLIEKAREGAIDAATVDGAICGTALVVHLVKGQRFEIDCKQSSEILCISNGRSIILALLTICLGGRRFSCGPVGAYRTRAQPLSVHGRNGGFRFLQEWPN